LRSADIIQVEVSSKFRTNVGVMSPNAATVRITQLDAAGAVLATHDLTLAPLQLTQIALSVPVVNGRVHIESSAPLFAYGSLVDNRTGDPTFVAAE